MHTHGKPNFSLKAVLKDSRKFSGKPTAVTFLSKVGGIYLEKRLHSTAVFYDTS